MPVFSHSDFYNIGVCVKNAPQLGEEPNYSYICSLAGTARITIGVDQPDALRRILTARNENYKLLETMHRDLIVRDRSHRGPHLQKRINLVGGSQIKQKGYYVPLRCLKTRHTSHHFFSAKRYGTKAARRLAFDLYGDNSKAFKALSDTFNAEVFAKGLLLAEKEIKTRKPQLQALLKNKDKRWLRIYNDVYPDGLANTYDPCGVIPNE